MILGEFVPPGAKWYMGEFRAARGIMVYVGNFVPPGA